MRTKVFLLTPLAWACVAAMAQTLPTGGTVTQGTGSVSVNGKNMVVNQSSGRMIADWQSFSIGAGHSVQFVQPSSSSVALNRVLGSDPSRIFGSLSANGHVYLQNPNGVLFAPGAQVDVGSLVATTLNADAQQFMAGRLSLSGGNAASGAVVNEGSITTAPGGHVVLAGPQVSNAGSIVTPGGTTALAAGSAVEIDPTGAGLLTISIPVAAVNAHLANTGTITADGGRVSLQAAATDAALRSVMQVGGVVRARSIEERDGQIVLSGGTSGIVAVSGTLDASGGGATLGGTVKVLGDRVALLGTARVDASGGSGGGTVLLGGNLQGQGPEANAMATYVAEGAFVDARARERGDGGKVIVWADGGTTYAGRIDARGGATQGNGGFVEVSGKQMLDFRGAVDTRAPAGSAGSLLLDPTNLTIGSVANVNGDGTLGDDLATSPLLAGDFAGANSQITAARVATLLSTGNVLLQASNSMSVTAPLTVAAGGAASTLTMNSPTINFNAPVTLNNASLVADTNQNFSDAINVNAAIQSLNSVALTSTDISIDATITAGAVNLISRVITSPTVTEGAAGGIVTPLLTLGRLSNAASQVSLTSANNRIGTLVLDSQNANVRVDNVSGAALTVRGTVDQNLTFTSASAISQAAGAGGALDVGGGFTLTTTGADPIADAVDLSNAGNDFGGIVNFDVASNFSLATADTLAITGSAARNIALDAGGAFALSGAITSTSVANPSNITIDVASFSNGNNAPLVVQPGGRFIIRSANPGPDFLGIATGTGLADINHVVFSGWAGADPAAGNVYFSGRTATITPPGTDRADVSKVYDGTTAFTYVQTGTSGSISASAPPSAPLLFDTVTDYTVTSSGTFADRNAGTDKGYTVAATNDVVATASTGASIYGAQFAGFTRPGGTGAAGVSAITPRPLTSTGITATDRVYDASAVVALTTAGATLNNTVSGDNVALVTSGATGTMVNKNVGTDKAVTVGGLALTGTDAANYTVTDASGATVDITPAALTSSGYTAVNRVYDGTTTVGLNTGAATLTGVIESDVVTIGAANGTMADKNVGTAKPVTIGTITLAGADAGNYTATGSGAASVDITPRPVTSTGVAGVDRAYDGTTVVALNGSAATLANTVAGDNVTLSLAGASGTMSDKNVGAGKPVSVTGLTLSGADAVNYSLTDASNPTVTISPRALTPTGISATNRIEDGTTTVTIDASGATVIGVVSGDVVTLDASGATGSVADPAPGVAKPVTVSGLVLGGADAINYSILGTPVTSSGEGLTVRILTVGQAAFEDIRYKEYLQGVSDAQEPFRRAMAEALAAGFGKENIRKQLTRGLVFETGLAAPAVDRIEPARRPADCTAGAALACVR
jgi:filamentous hemagglutinin family protein